MAMYHAHHKVLSRSTRNTVASLAYRSGTCLVNGYTGEVSDYRTKGVQHVEILLPNDAPLWAQEICELVKEDRAMGLQTLSNIAEDAEKRKDSQLYREFEFSLPKELSDTQNIVLANAFVKDQCCGRGMLAIQNFHFDVDAKTETRKPHCHTLLLTRSLTEEGLSPLKEREWNAKEFHNTLREQWAQYQNFHLKLHGFEARVDHRSYEDQGIELEPQPKLGKNVLEMEQKGREAESALDQPKTWRFQDFMDTQTRNMYRLLKNPEIILKVATSSQVVFGRSEIKKAIGGYIQNRELQRRMFKTVIGLKELVLLKEGPEEAKENGIYTTASLLKAELELVKRAVRLSQQKHTKALHPETFLEKTQQSPDKGGTVLSEEQGKAVSYMTQGNQLSCIVGYAGAGKTTALAAAKERWEAQGFQVRGLAPTGRAAQNLQESGIDSQTLHRFLYQFEQGRSQFNSKTVLVLDEAGMVDMGRMGKFLQAVETLGVKAVVVGDGAQLQAVEAGDAFRLITSRMDVFYLQDVRRQEQEWQREATKAFGRLETESALKMYLDKGQVTFVAEHVPQVEKLVAAGDMKGVVALYNLSHRMVGRLWHVGLAKPELYSRELLDTWVSIKKSCAMEIAGNLDAYRSQMKALNVDPIVFAENFVGGATREERLSSATELAERWKLPMLEPNQPRHLCESKEATREALLAAWSHSLQKNPEDSHLILAYTNKDVQVLNQEVRKIMRESGQIQGAEVTYTTERQVKDPLVGVRILKEDKSFAVGDRLLFSKNENGLGVKNGMVGTIEALSPASITVKLPSAEKEGEEKRITFSPNLYKSFDHGWAVTIHKAQGITVDRVFTLASFEQYRNLAYVSMTRHRKDVQVFGSTLDFWVSGVFLHQLSSSQDKSLAHDYGNEGALSQKLEGVQQNKLKATLEKMSHRLEAMGFVAKHLTQQTIDTFLSSREESELRQQPYVPVQAFEKTHGTREDATRDTLGQRTQYEASKWAQGEEIAKEAFMRKHGIEKLRPIDLLAIERETHKTLSTESRIVVEHAQQGKPLSDSQVFIMAMRKMKQLAQEQASLEKEFAKYHTSFVAKSIAENIIHRKALHGADPTPDHVQQSLHILKDIESKDVERLQQIEQVLERHPLKGQEPREVAEYAKALEKEERLRSLTYEGQSPHENNTDHSLEKAIKEFEKKTTELETQRQQQQAKERELVR